MKIHLELIVTVLSAHMIAADLGLPWYDNAVFCALVFFAFYAGYFRGRRGE